VVEEEERTPYLRGNCLNEFKRILVPVDEEEESGRAFTTALDLAERIGGRITTIHVIEVEPPVLGGIDTNLEEEEAVRGKKILEGFIQKARERGVEHEDILVKGEAAREIIERSRTHDLIIMGTRGRSTLASAIMGSVADRVMRKCCCPVLLIR
jgi:nucleotide-binding universal stress UspA family protein